MTHDELKANFDMLGPWITGFTYDAKNYGGDYHVQRDERMIEFMRVFPSAKRILELGSLEGGHSLALCNIPKVEEIIAIEARSENIARAKFVIDLFEEHRIKTIQEDLETFDLSSLGMFDVCFCVGLLYHLVDPVTLLRKIATVTDRLFLWTHTSNTKEEITHLGYKGIWYKEYGYKDMLSGLSPKSFWPTRKALLDMLSDTGWTDIQIPFEDNKQINGHNLTLIARRSTP